MKATGIVRRVDSLGRVVIPKEIRHTLRIQEGAPLEIYTDRDGSVTFRKYSPLGDLQDLAAALTGAIRAQTGCACAVTDRDTVLAVAGGPRKALEQQPCSRALDHLMEQRSLCRFPPEAERVPLCDAEPAQVLSLMVPVTGQGDLLGCVALLRDPRSPVPPDAAELVVRTAADFLGRQAE